MTKIIVAIAGFTGKMGQLITKALLNRHQDVEIYGIVRNMNNVKSELRNNPAVKLFESASTDLEALRRSLTGASVCICCYLGDNTLMIAGQKLLIDACAAEGVERFIASDWTLDFSQLQFGDHPGKDPMKHIAAYLDNSDSVKGVHVLNGIFMEVLFASFIGYCDPEKQTFWYYGTGDEPMDTTSMKDAAEYTAEIALDKTAIGYIQVAGDTKSVKQLADVWTTTYGIPMAVKSAGTLDMLRDTMTATYARNPQNPFAWMGQYYQYWMAQDITRMSNPRNEDYRNVVPMTVEDYLGSLAVEQVQGQYFSL